MPAPAMNPGVKQLFESYAESVQELMTGARLLLFAELSGAKEFPDVETRVIGYGTAAWKERSPAPQRAGR